MDNPEQRNENSIKIDQADIFGKTGNGTLDFSLASSPDWENDPNGKVLHVDIHDMDFNAIYVDALRSKNIQALQVDFSFGNLDFQKNRAMFIEAFPACPLLGAYYAMYGEDYVFDPETATKFKGECERFQSIELSQEADLALRKLIYGFTQASKHNMYLVWACD
jgi:hypothetical protein